MTFSELFSLATDGLNSNRLRTSLSLLGIAIGTAAIIMVGAASRSGRAVIFDELMTFGLRSVWVFRSHDDERPGDPQRNGTGIDLDDIRAIEKECRLIARVTPITQQMVWVSSKGRYHHARLQAVNHEHAIITGDSVEAGRLLSWIDFRHGSPVAVIGANVARGLFPQSDPIGKQIRVGGGRYTVIGILGTQSRDFLNSIGIGRGSDPNDRVLVPITAYDKQTSRREVQYLQAEVKDPALAQAAAGEMIAVLRRRHRGRYSYKSQVMQDYIDVADHIMSTVAWIGGVAAAISLLVGGIGIMNVLSTSVLERTSEIGLRKAVGARRRDILLQFLVEAMLLCILGGAVGVILGASGILLLEHASGKPKLLAWGYVLAALLVSLVVGLLAGLYPAYRAAMQDPIEALRYE